MISFLQEATFALYTPYIYITKKNREQTIQLRYCMYCFYNSIKNNQQSFDNLSFLIPTGIYANQLEVDTFIYL